MYPNTVEPYHGQLLPLNDLAYEGIHIVYLYTNFEP